MSNFIPPIEVDFEKKTEEFKELLGDIESLSDKRKSLLAELYNNITIDRMNAYAMLQILVEIVGTSSADWAVHNRVVTSLLSTMQKANEQLGKLAEHINQLREDEDTANPEEIFSQISGKK
jgi:hypothetical protein